MIMKTVFTLTLCVVSFSLFAQCDSAEICKTVEWRMHSNAGSYNKAIKCLNRDLEKAENKHQKHSILWHLGQMYACNNEYDTAIVFMQKSTHYMVYFIDRQFYWYYRGTMAFLKRDKKKLHKYYMKLWPYRNGYYRKNAVMLKSLHDDFEKPYREIFQKQRLNQVLPGI